MKTLSSNEKRELSEAQARYEASVARSVQLRKARNVAIVVVAAEVAETVVTIVAHANIGFVQSATQIMAGLTAACGCTAEALRRDTNADAAKAQQIIREISEENNLYPPDWAL